MDAQWTLVLTGGALIACAHRSTAKYAIVSSRVHDVASPMVTTTKRAHMKMSAGSSR